MLTASVKLRDILDSYFETRELSDFDELKRKCRSALKGHCDFLFVFREHRYFDTKDTDEDLFFQFFSFGQDGENREISFSDRDDLIEEINKWSGKSEKFTSKYCQLYIKSSTLTIEDQTKIFNLLKRIIVFHYLNSGSKAHFLSSVSQRMTKSFWRTDSGNREYTRESAMAFLCDRLKIDAALYAIIDEPENGNSPVYDCLNFYYATPNFKSGIIEQALRANTAVSSDAKKSISIRNKTTGTHNGIPYGISTISGSHIYVDENEEVKNHAITPEFLIVFSGESKKLSIDKINIATTFLNSVIRSINEIEEVQIRRMLEDNCRYLERALGENPVASKDEFESRYRTLILHYVMADIGITSRFQVCLRLFRPSSNLLQLLFPPFDVESPDDILENISIYDDSSVSARAFRKDETISLWSKDKIREKQKIIDSGIINSTRRFEKRVENSKKLTSFTGNTGEALVAVPIRINDIIVGTVEFLSPTRSDLEPYVEECEIFADQCGEFYRRLELANDRGWLVRMHFLHAARHRLQHIVDEISEHSKELGNELIDLISSSVVNEQEISEKSNYLTSHECAELLNENALESFKKHSPVHARAVRGIFSELLKLTRVSRRNFILLNEVIEALAANVRKHGFRPDGLKVFAGRRCGEISTIVLSYKPKHTYDDQKRTQRVCISPMPALTGAENGYSYGLFLLATQIRMSGGWITSHWEEPDEFEESPFGFTVILNAEIPSE